MDPLSPQLIIGGLITAIGSLVSTIVYLSRVVLADKNKQIAEEQARTNQMREERDEWKETALSLLRTAETLAEPVAQEVKQSRRTRTGTGTDR